MSDQLKKPYSTPQLVVYGDVRNLTQGNKGSMGNDNGMSSIFNKTS